jgi:type IV pilus assembly protein PilV
MKQQSGFTLIEILVAVVILALGLLGMAGMQANSLRNNQSAYFRSQATVLAYDILDRMRANRTAAAGGQYDIALGAAAAGAGIVLDDLTEWKATLANELASGDGSVLTLNNLVTVQIHWNEGKPDAGEAAPACGAEALHRKVFCTSTQL